MSSSDIQLHGGASFYYQFQSTRNVTISLVGSGKIHKMLGPKNGLKVRDPMIFQMNDVG
jgi:hypothetical protein